MGINITGLEYSVPTQSEVSYFAASGFNHIRLSIDWQLLQPSLGGALDKSYLESILTTVGEARTSGLSVDLDLHNYGQYNGNLIGSAQVPISSFADVWGRLASVFSGDNNVMFGLMNEPQLVDPSEWLTAVNAAIGAIRATGSSQEILVSGIGWDGGQSWTTNGNSLVLGAAGAIKDPDSNYAFEVHQYLDDTSGTNDWVASPSIGSDRLQAITQWAESTGSKLYLGEFGVDAYASSLGALNNMLQFIDAHQNVWQGEAYWSAGALPTGYAYSANPIMGLLDTAQVSILKQYTGATQVANHLSDGSYSNYFYLPDAKIPSIVDDYSASGDFADRKILSTDGSLNESIVHVSNGDWAAVTYAKDTGQPVTDITYNSIHVRVSQTNWSADGSSVRDDYDQSGYNVISEIHFDNGGKITSATVSDINNHTNYEFEGGALQTAEHYDGKWNFIDRLTFNSGGALIESQSVDPTSGNNVIEYFASNGTETRSLVYSSDWQHLSDQPALGNVALYAAVASTAKAILEMKPVDIPSAIFGSDQVAVGPVVSTPITPPVSDPVVSTPVTPPVQSAGQTPPETVSSTPVLSTPTAINGTVGNDTLNGTAGADTIHGLGGNDVIHAGAGDDLIDIGAGKSAVDGGDGFDTLSFANATSGVRFRLGTLGYQAVNDKITVNPTNIEAVVGSAFNDTFVGSSHDDRMSGGAGNDSFTSGGGHDVIDGGTGIDTLSFDGVTHGVTLSLASQAVQTLDSTWSIQVSNVETVTGSAYADVLTANDTGSTLNGGGGNDMLIGGAGNDHFVGGGGEDTVSYANARAAVTVSLLATSAQQTGGAGTDTLSAIEDLIGSSFNDTLFGDKNSNKIDGGAGNDVIKGAGGADTLTGGAGADHFVYTTLSDSTLNAYDTITDFSHADGDKIDLSALDANSKVKGLNSFSLVDHFTGVAGQLEVISQNDGYMVEGDVNGDGHADLAIFVHSNTRLLASDFTL